MINKMFDSFYRRCRVTEEAMVLTIAELSRLGINYSKRTIQRKQTLDKLLGSYTLLHHLTIPESNINSKCKRVANYLQVHQEQAVWWSQSYVTWLHNSHQSSQARPQLSKLTETTEMDEFKEDDEDGADGNNSAEFSIDHPQQ